MKRYSLSEEDIENILKAVEEGMLTTDEIGKMMKVDEIVLEFNRTDVENELARQYDNKSIDYDMTSKKFQDTVDGILETCSEDGFDLANHGFNEKLEELVQMFV